MNKEPWYYTSLSIEGRNNSYVHDPLQAQAQELVWEKMILNKISSEQLDSLITQAQMAQSVSTVRINFF